MGNHSSGLLLANNDRRFHKRMYTQHDPHTGPSKPYMRSSIDLSFDEGQYVRFTDQLLPSCQSKPLPLTKTTKGSSSRYHTHMSKDRTKIHNQQPKDL
mmetsp:Transcript_10819/g.13598  ORF Transcript_10819/g.13598 Transcript_10819/m.13598 type:complete len:98 (+) Transcript_10819:621-914(+)